MPARTAGPGRVSAGARGPPTTGALAAHAPAARLTAGLDRVSGPLGTEPAAVEERSAPGSPRIACEHVFVTSQGGPHARFRRAVATRNSLIATAAAAELPRLSLADALALLLLYRDGDRRRFERGVVRWHALLCLEVRTLSPADAQLALAALNALGDGEALPAATALRELLSAHGQRDAAGALGRWLDGAAAT
jgi:hypothetical protein